MPIRARIVLPLAGLFLVSYGALAAFSIWMVARAAEERTIQQMRTMARTVESLDLSFTPASLEYIRTASGAELVAAAPAGPIPGLSTVGPDVLAEISTQIASNPAFARNQAAQISPKGGGAYVVVGSTLRDGRRLYLLTPSAAIAEKQLEAAGPLIFLSTLGLVAVIGVGFLIAKGIARPIEELALHARRVVDLQADAPLAVRGGSIETEHLVSSLNRMLETLRETQAKTVEAQRARVIREMAGSVAHEIKNPLQAIQMIVQTAGGLSESDRKILLDEIRRVELASLELLSLSGPVKLNREPVSLKTVVGRTLDLLGRSLDHRGIRVEKRFMADGELQIDPDRIQRAVMNLVLNGAQAMPSGGRMTVQVDRTPEGWGRVSVTDEGRGIPEEVRSRLFEPFFTTKQDGVGLGLFVTKTIVEQHGGRIGVESGAGGRTTVSFEVPG